MDEQVCVEYAGLRAMAGGPGDELVLVHRDELTHLLAAYDQLRERPSSPDEAAPTRRRRKAADG